MSDNEEQLVGEFPARLIRYDYDNPSRPFTSEQIAHIESIREFLSEDELAQARRLEVFHYNTFFGTPNELGIAGLRPSEKTYCLYLQRYDDKTYGEIVDKFIDTAYERRPVEKPGGIRTLGYRVTTPDGGRHYALECNGNLQAWIDRMLEVAAQFGTLMAWFDRGKFCLTDGRRFAFSDLRIEELEGGKGKYVPKDW